MSDLQVKMQSLSEDFTKLQKELQEAIMSRQKLEAQMQENLGVQKEFEQLKDDETIYKLIGPVLLKQDRSDAESTVNGRLEFIRKEISRLEPLIEETQTKIEKKKSEIIQLQTSAQQAGAAAGAGGKPKAVAA
ncbi:Prefoldin [Podospora appendiculata]|uniref:Prefoldin n=1 Tax=Podospora appendiculata TaxID=314037 RepID=A0AAE1CE50_9PEZI|nr:Prefoldin [Podospora appendiculata]